MHYTRYKVRGVPLDGHPFSTTSLLQLFKDVAGVTPNDIKQEGTDILFFFYSEEDVDKLVLLVKQFYQKHLDLYFPRRYLATRSVIIHDLSRWIVDHMADEDTFMDDLIASNPDLGLHQILFFNNRHSLRLTFDTVAMAHQATRNGVYSLGIHIPPVCVTMERFLNINQCLKCYEYTHSTRKCKQPIQKCSLCSEDHHYSICKSKKLCCLLCKGEHAAISTRCPHRQEIIKKMKKTSASAGASSSAASNQETNHSDTTTTPGINLQAANFPKLPGSQPTASGSASHWGPSSQPTSNASSQPAPPPHLDHAPYSTVQALTSTASMIAGTNPREYVRILNILFQANGFPTFTVPEEVFNTSTSPSSPPNPDITVNAAELSDLLTTATKPAPPATSTHSTQTPSTPPPVTTSVPPLRHESSERSTPAPGPMGAQQPSKHPARPTASAAASSDSSDEDVSVGTPTPPWSCLDPYTAADFLLDTSSNASFAMSTRSKTPRPAKKPGKKKKNADDMPLRKSGKQ